MRERRRPVWLWGRKRCGGVPRARVRQYRWQATSAPPARDACGAAVSEGSNAGSWRCTGARRATDICTCTDVIHVGLGVWSNRQMPLLRSATQAPGCYARASHLRDGGRIGRGRSACSTRDGGHGGRWTRNPAPLPLAALRRACRKRSTHYARHCARSPAVVLCWCDHSTAIRQSSRSDLPRRCSTT